MARVGNFELRKCRTKHAIFLIRKNLQEKLLCTDLFGLKIITHDTDSLRKKIFGYIKKKNVCFFFATIYIPPIREFIFIKNP